MRGPKGTVQAAILVVVLALAAGCSAGGSSGDGAGAAGASSTLEPKETPTTGGSVVIGLPAETNGWNPALAQWADAGSMVGSAMLEPLMQIMPDGSFQPYLAESLTPNDKLDAWTIRIKPNIRFHDGTTLDAPLVKRNLDFYRGGPGALSAVAQRGIIRDVIVKDPVTVEVQMNQPWGAYPVAIAAGSGWMMSSSMLDDPQASMTNPVGTGPFKFDKWLRDDRLTAKKFDGYWRKDADGGTLPYLDSIEFRVIPDGAQRAGSLRTGDVDMILTTRADDIENLAGDFNVIKDYTSEQTFVQLNTGEKPFDNVHARKAIAHATDRNAIAASQGRELLQSNSPFPSSTPWGKATADAPAVASFDPNKAREELETYKRETGASELTFKLTTLPDLSYQTMAQQLQAQWKAVGINAELDTVEQTAFITRLATGDTTGTLMRNYGYSDPDSDYYFFHKKMAVGKGQLNINFTQTKDDALSAAFDQGRESRDQATREAAYRTAVARLNELAVNVWLFNTPYAIIAKPTVRGLNPARETGFGNFMPKLWVGALWVKK